jgi:hypothetical protein
MENSKRKRHTIEEIIQQSKQQERMNEKKGEGKE